MSERAYSNSTDGTVFGSKMGRFIARRVEEVATNFRFADKVDGYALDAIELFNRRGGGRRRGERRVYSVLLYNKSHLCPYACISCPPLPNTIIETYVDTMGEERSAPIIDFVMERMVHSFAPSTEFREPGDTTSPLFILGTRRS